MNAVQAAEARALRIYPRSDRFRKPYVAGARAALAGKPAESCPYRVDPRKTWGGVWRRAWMLGYRSVAEDA
jgi:ribosome modulation factor